MESVFSKKDKYLKKEALPIVERVCYYERINTDFLTSSAYTIILMIKGCVSFTMIDGKKINVQKGEMAFIPIGIMGRIEIVPKTKIIITRLSALENWNLYCPIPENTNKPETCFTDKMSKTQKEPEVTAIKTNLSAYIRSLNSCISCAAHDAKLMEIKVKELLMLIRLNYPQEELQQFFSAAVGKELSFVEYIEQNWDKYATLQEFADAMHLSMRQFTRRFQALYNNSPYQWILDQKSRRIHRELIYTQKTLARISSEQHFKSVSHFNVFCKIHLGQTPGAIRKDRDIKLKTGEEKDGERDKRERKNLHANN